jgi:uncharacterized membrane protein
MNLLAMRALLDPPEAVFAPLLVVDPVITYGWMACLIGLSGRQEAIDRWLRAAPVATALAGEAPAEGRALRGPRAWVPAAVLSAAVVAGARWLASRLPGGGLVRSTEGWVVLVATTAALGLASIPQIRRIGQGGGAAGSFSLYIVLAAAGAGGSLSAFAAAPAWLVLGAGAALTHGLVLLAAGRLWRVPLALLATASQANLGGVVSAPLVGATYHRSLAAVGLLLALAGNALGTYVGWGAALLARWILAG